MGRPVLRCLLAAVLTLAVAWGGPAWPQASPQPTAPEAPAESPEDLPPGEHREEVFYYCTPCHGTAVIRRSRLSRERWDELMDWMTEKHGMPVLEGEFRQQVVDYLARALPPSSGPARRGANPFLNE